MQTAPGRDCRRSAGYKQRSLVERGVAQLYVRRAGDLSAFIKHHTSVAISPINEQPQFPALSAPQLHLGLYTVMGLAVCCQLIAGPLSPLHTADADVTRRNCRVESCRCCVGLRNSKLLGGSLDKSEQICQQRVQLRRVGVGGVYWALVSRSTACFAADVLDNEPGRPGSPTSKP